MKPVLRVLSLDSPAIVEAAIGIEPMYKGFADPCLTTWLRRRARRIIEGSEKPVKQFVSVSHTWVRYAWDKQVAYDLLKVMIFVTVSASSTEKR